MAAGMDIALVAGKSSLMTTQKQMAVISNNVSKANDPDYHRQTTSIDPNVMVMGDSGYFGTGAHIAMVVRQYDAALETSLRNAKSSNSYEQAYYRQLTGIEDVLAPGVSDQLDGVIQTFATMMQSVATSPEELANRTAFIGSAENLVDRLNQNYDNMSQIRNYISTNDANGTGAITKALEDVKNLLQRVPALNKRIRELEENGFRNQKANDLRDERDKIVTGIAEYIDITVSEGSDSRYTIICDGNTLINGTYTPDLSADYMVIKMTNTPPSPHFVPSIVLNSDNATTVNLSSGKVEAYVDAHAYVTGKMDEIYSYAQNYGDSITDPGAHWEAANAYVLNDAVRPVPSNGYAYTATAVVGNSGAAQPAWPVVIGNTVVDGGVTWTVTGKFSVVNASHMEGYDLYGNSGGKLFTMAATQPAAGNILSVAISESQKVAASSVGDETAADPAIEVEKGNGGNMLSLWSDINSTTTPDPALSGESILSYPNRYISTISRDVASAKDRADTSSNIQNMFQNAVFEVSAVNMDDEMTDMLEVQRTYQATAKLMNVIDQMIGTVLEML